MPAPKLDRCPACGCDLTAEPPPGRCPDCGLEYDEHTRVWLSPESWPHLAGVYCTVGLVAGLFGVAAQSISLPRVSQPIFPLVLAIAAPAVGLLFRRLIGGRITGRFVALTPPGIVVGTRNRPVLVRWAEFERLTQHRGVPKLERREHPALLPLDDIFDSPADLETFRRALKEAVRRYTAAGADGGDPWNSQLAGE